MTAKAVVMARGDLRNNEHLARLGQVHAGVMGVMYGERHNPLWAIEQYQRVLNGEGGRIQIQASLSEAAVLAQLGFNVGEVGADPSRFYKHSTSGDVVDLARVFLHQFGLNESARITAEDYVQVVVQSGLQPLGWKEMCVCLSNASTLPRYWHDSLKKFHRILFCGTTLNIKVEGVIRKYVPGLCWGHKPRTENVQVSPPVRLGGDVWIDEEPAQIIPRGSMMPALFELECVIGGSNLCAVLPKPKE